MPSELQIHDPLRDGTWDAQILSHPGASIFHSTAWARVLHDTYGYRPRYLTAAGSDTGPAYIPVMEITGPFRGKRGVSLPFSDFCGPLLPPSPLPAGLAADLFAVGKREGWRTLELRGGRRLLPDAPACLQYVGHELPLSTDEQTMWTRLKPPVRRAIRKAEAAGVVITSATTTAAVLAFYRLHGRTRRRHGLPPPPFAFFRNLQRHVLARDMGVVVLASHEGRVVAGAVFLRFGATALFKYGASDIRHQNLRANDLVMWQGMRWHAQHGCTALSLGKTRPDHAGLLQFKRGWGGDEVAIEYFKQDLTRDTFVVAEDHVSGWYNTVFRHMPVPVARFCGALLYKHMG